LSAHETQHPTHQSVTIISTITFNTNICFQRWFVDNAQSARVSSS
jgi:hypothetical protein